MALLKSRVSNILMPQPLHVLSIVPAACAPVSGQKETEAKRLERRAIAEDVLLSAATAHFNSAPSFEEGEEVWQTRTPKIATL